MMRRGWPPQHPENPSFGAARLARNPKSPGQPALARPGLALGAKALNEPGEADRMRPPCTMTHPSEIVHHHSGDVDASPKRGGLRGRTAWP